jgi:hypothetical protein
MPYSDASSDTVQRMFEIADDDRPDAAILVGQFSQRAYFERVRAIWPDAREVEAHSLLVEEGGQNIRISVVIGAAMAATFAHLAVPAAGAFVLLDNLASQQTVLTLSDEVNRRIETGKDAILRASVAAVSGLVATRNNGLAQRQRRE